MFLIILISLVISATQGCWWNYQRKIPRCPPPPLTPHGGTRECEVEDLVYLSGNSCVFMCRTTGETINTQCSPGLPGTWSPAPYFDNCCPLVVDTYTWLAIIGGVVLATYFLRLAIINNISRKRKRKSLAGELICPFKSSEN